MVHLQHVSCLGNSNHTGAGRALLPYLDAIPLSKCARNCTLPGWGGWRWPYEWFDEAMRAAGFDGRPTSEDFLDGDALFNSGSEDTCDLLLRYMRNTYGDDVEMRQVDEVDGGMSVYEFVWAEQQRTGARA